MWEQPHESPPKIEVEPEPAPVEDFQSPETTPIEEPEPMEVENVPAPLCRISLERRSKLSTRQSRPRTRPEESRAPAKEEKISAEKSMQAKQEVLQFEPVNRGRFEKSEPTIVEGEDLDVPTYLRKKIKVK